MSALIKIIVQTALTLLAGVGVGELADKVAADKLPQYESVMPDLLPGKTGFKPMKLVYTVLFMALGGFIVAFIAKKANIKILKK
jgi:hypothetical protein